jgi:hypothetical protein
MSKAPSLAEQALQQTVLSSLVGQTISISKVGQEWKALCPFHEEKTPSFYINDKKGFFHCFGCGAHGDAIDWIVKREGLSRPDAISKLANLAGIPPKKGGGKLNRSETVTVRLDPKLNYLCELASRSQRRTKSSFIEWAVAEALGSVYLNDLGDRDSEYSVTVKQHASDLWHVDDADRLVALALIAPTLLNHEEQMIWRLIRENGYIWRGRFDARGEWIWDVRDENLIRDRLRDKWETFRAVAAGEDTEGALPTWTKHREDDVPF